MRVYKLTTSNVVLFTDTLLGECSCSDTHPEYLDWLAQGNTPLPADPIPPSQIWENIKQKRTQIQHGGVLVGTKWFHSDDSSRIQQLGLLMMGSSIPSNLQWKTMD